MPRLSVDIDLTSLSTERREPALCASDVTLDRIATPLICKTHPSRIADMGRPREILSPTILDITQVYDRQFIGMTVEPVALAELLEVRARLVADIQMRLDDNARRFLLSLLHGTPDLDAIGLPGAATLPPISWKVLNLNRLRAANSEKLAIQRAHLEALF